MASSSLLTPLTRPLFPTFRAPPPQKWFPALYTKTHHSSFATRACSNNGPEPTEPPKPTRRARKKKDPSAIPSTTSKRTRTTRSTKSPKEPDQPAKAPEAQIQPDPQLGLEEIDEAVDFDDKDEDFDDGIDFPYPQPPLVCCFGAVQREFIPMVRVSPRQMDQDKYSTWKILQWDPPEFARSPGGPVSNVAVSHARLGGRVALMGKVGDDEFGNDLVLKMNLEKVQTRALKIEPEVKTATSYMRIKFSEEDGKMKAETSRACADDAFKVSDVNVAVLKEARIFHFNSGVLLSPTMLPALFRAIKLSKKYGGTILFDPNLALPLWESRDKTWGLIKKAWEQSDVIEVSKQELEFLLDDDYHERRRNYKPQYYSESYELMKSKRDYYHYTKEDISPLWHDGIKILLVTHGTLRIHYYTQEFEGFVVGTEDVLVTPFTCDRTGSGDAVVAAFMRKLAIHPEICHNQDLLEKQLRFAVAAGIITQWTVGAVRGFPTESATQNLKEQVYVPSMW